VHRSGVLIVVMARYDSYWDSCMIASCLPRLGMALLFFLLLAAGTLTGGAGLFAEPARTPVRIAFDLVGKAPAEAFEVRGEARSFSEPDAPSIAFDGTSVSAAGFSLPPGRWVISVAAPGRWCEPLQLEVAGAAVVTTMRLFPAGQVAGRFPEPEPELPAPTQLQVFFRSSPSVAVSARVPQGREDCVIEGRDWRCPLPAGSLDLRFQASGAIPAYLWEVAVQPGGETSLRTIPLRAGSTVQGWVRTADGSEPTGRAEVRLSPRARGALGAAEQERLRSVQSLRTGINPRGFFQFETVPPGEYLLEVRQPPFAATSTTVQVVPNRVTEIVDPPLLLEFPKRLEVVVQPPMAPGGSPWELALRRLESAAGTSETIVEGLTAGVDGLWRHEGLEPGDYLFELGTSGSRWHTEEVALGGPETQVFVDLEVVEVQGEVQLGKEPLPALLTFGGRHGTERIRAQADGEGRFETFLPRAGAWRVRVESEIPMMDREIAAVTVERALDGSPTELVVRLPNTAVAGRVLDERGEAVPNALITARSLLTDGRRERVQIRAREGGRFLLEGLAEGPTELSAIGPDDQASELRVVELGEDRAAKDVVLTLRKQRRVAGFIGSESGPVPGARIKAVPVGVPVPGVSTVTSGVDGRFEISVPPATREVLLTVGPPGFGLRMLRLPLPPSGPLALRAEVAAGSLRLEADEPLQGEPGQAMVVVFHGNAHEGLAYLHSWAASTHRSAEPTPEVALIPALEPGDYRACWVELDEMLGLVAGSAPRGPCVGGTVVAGGELVLALGRRTKLGGS
jgi:hypothetical protein